MTEADSPDATSRPRLPVGVALGSIGADARWWLESARRLDAAGYDGIWCWDHFMSRGKKANPVLEQWTTLAAAGAVTERIGIGTFVTNVMTRHPAVLARMAGTLQEISGGRLTVGLGAGGDAAENEAYGIPFPAIGQRVARLEEAVAVLRALWTGGPVAYEGRFFRLRDAVAFPLPDPAPRILIGAGSPAGVRLAARIGDGWAAEVDEFADLEPRWREALDRNGRRRSEVQVVLGFGSGRSGQDALRGSPWVEEPRAAADEWRSRGADRMIVP
ncbi:MAG TPA: LLM class flavin-dependent oxidoreductase, partial [Candidatus Acidoferrum sp.]|nr:LLM class flavin-dependent oxidoreductase [Candidatus Acidoferrum sp.]